MVRRDGGQAPGHVFQDRSRKVRHSETLANGGIIQLGEQAGLERFCPDGGHAIGNERAN